MLRDRIRNDIREMWEKVASSASALLGMPPEDLAVFEHSHAKVQEARCLGEGKFIQLLNRKCQPLEPPENYSFDCGSRQDSYWQHAKASFYLAETEAAGVVEMRFGPKYGRGFYYAIVNQDGRPEIAKERRWVS